MNKAILKPNSNANHLVMYMAFELSNTKWKLAFWHDGRSREITVVVGDGTLEDIRRAIKRTKEKFRLASDAPVVSCYEAGRDGFWLHRFLEAEGVTSLVVDSASIEVNRRARRTKTDRMDVKKLLSMLKRYWEGERGVWSVVRVPQIADEDARRLNREWERLNKERGGHLNRIRGLLVTQGVRVVSWHDFSAQWLEKVRLWDGSRLPEGLKTELVREWERADQVERHQEQLERAYEQRMERSSDPRSQKVLQLTGLKSIGVLSANLLVMEFFGWRKFRNRREVGAAAGLTGTPYSSGDSNREQGISKAGNRRVRSVMVELSWMWLRWQPQSKLSQWYVKRFLFAQGPKRSRLKRIGIVAVARRLLVDLWRYLEYGVVPDGAVLKRQAA